MRIPQTRFKVVIRPGMKENKIIGFDAAKEAYVIHINQRAEDNKANKELIKFLSKELGKRVVIKSGLRSKEKIIEVKI